VTAVLRPSPRILAAAIAGTLAVLSAAGVTSYLAFDQASSLKWGITVVGSCLLVVAATAREPLRIIVALAIIAAPFSSFHASFLGVDVSVLWPILALGWLVAILGREPSSGRSKLALASVWFVGLMSIPLLEADGLGTQATLLATMVAMGWLVAQVAREPGGTRIVLGALGACTVLQGAIAIWQFHTGQQLNLYGGAGDAVFGSNYFFSFDDINRPTGGLEDPISLGNVLALGLPALLYTVLTARTLLPRVGALLGSGVVLYALSISLSRMSWFGAVAGVAIAVALLPRGWRMATGLGVSLVVVVTVSIAMAAGGQTLIDRFDTALSPTARSSVTRKGDETRLRLWAAGRDIARANPVVGVGFGDLPRELGKYGLDYGSFTHVHSTYLMIAACAGAVGVLALLIILWAFVADVRVGRRANPIAAAALAGCLGVTLVVWLTDWTIGYPPVAALFATVFGAAAGLARRVPLTDIE